MKNLRRASENQKKVCLLGYRIIKKIRGDSRLLHSNVHTVHICKLLLWHKYVLALFQIPVSYRALALLSLCISSRQRVWAFWAARRRNRGKLAQVHSEHQVFNGIFPPPPFHLKTWHLIKNPDRAASAKNKREEDGYRDWATDRKCRREGGRVVEIKKQR